MGVGVGVYATTMVGATGAFRGATRWGFNLVVLMLMLMLLLVVVDLV